MKTITAILIKNGINEGFSVYFAVGIIIIAILLICLLINYIVKNAVMVIIDRIAKHNRYKLNEILISKKAFKRLAFFIPGIIVYFSAPIFTEFQGIIQKISLTYIFIVAIFVLSSVLDSINDYYGSLPISNIRPIKGFIQVIKIIVYIILIIVILANLIGKSPLIMLSGLGALAAVFSFVFKDLILGLVSGIQLTSNDMLRIGDWIEVPRFGADGEVVELSLTTVKVQNFDKTIVSLPAYALISDSFKNWRGMLEAGGRRIKRSINIDMNSIKFCTDDMLNHYKKFNRLLPHIAEKEKEINEYNADRNIDEANLFNGRRLTNVGLFRSYIASYIKDHPGIHKELLQLIRQLPPGEHGLPIEVYAFTSSTDWQTFEDVQSDIFDHLLAITGEFDLRVYQSPTGHDVNGYIGNG